VDVHVAEAVDGRTVAIDHAGVVPERPVVVRRAELGDRSALLVLARSFATSFIVDSDAFDRSFAEALDHSDSELLVATIDDVVVGYILASVHPTLYANGPVAWIEELMVRDTNRRSGVGGQLVGAVERWAVDRRAVLVALATRRADAFWQAAAYEMSATYLRKVFAP
jgi:GNAT superfamily N-acetyltransferase